MVIGTTGLDPVQTRLIHDAAKKVPILWAANMALGVNILLALVEKTASMLDPSYDIEVLEMHHRHKIDAPSGTALALGRARAEDPAAMARLVGEFMDNGWVNIIGGCCGTTPEHIAAIAARAGRPHLTLPAVRPSTRYGSIRTKSTTTGTMAITDAAKSRFQCWT